MARFDEDYVPRLRRHKARGLAVVRLGGRDFYCGRWGTPAARREYERVVGEWLAAGRRTSAPDAPAITVVEVLAAFMRHAGKHYVKRGEPTSEIGCLRAALRPVRELYGRTPAAEFGPLCLKAIRERWIAAGLARSTINKHCGRIRGAFKWATSEGLVPVAVWQALGSVAGLQRGRTEARETAPVEPVAEEIVAKTLAHLGPVVRAMVELQRASGMRPAEVCKLRPGDVDRSKPVWLYRVDGHKTEHRGRGRVVPLGPKSQAILRPFLVRAAESPCFSPAESMLAMREARSAARKTPLSCGNRPGSNVQAKPERAPRDEYDADSYRRAIARACKAAGVEAWAPNRLRHSAATEIRARFGLEAAQVILGHSRADVTQVYAERDLQKAVEVAAAIG